MKLSKFRALLDVAQADVVLTVRDGEHERRVWDGRSEEIPKEYWSYEVRGFYKSMPPKSLVIEIGGEADAG